MEGITKLNNLVIESNVDLEINLDGNETQKISSYDTCNISFSTPPQWTLEEILNSSKREDVVQWLLNNPICMQ